MGKANTAVDEENGETRQGKEPVEDISTVFGQVDECKTSEEQLEDDDVDGATLLVDICEEFGSHACSQNQSLKKRRPVCFY
jgi:hypothetical protein